MNSCVYISRIAHNRPNKNRFAYGIYMLYLDLDELDALSEKIPLFSYNRWNALSFHDEDHFIFVRQRGTADKIARYTVDHDARKYIGKNTKERISTLIGELKLGFTLGKVYILTNARNFGYIFNPVSFYFCYDTKGKFRAMFSEVSNTYRDQKMYYVKVDPNKKEFFDRQRKNFYVSPFIDHDTDLTWRFKVPGKRLSMQIESVKGKDAVLRTELTGVRKELSNLRVILLLLRYPMITLLIMIMIHYQALKLWLKKVTFRDKKQTDELIKKAIR